MTTPTQPLRPPLVLASCMLAMFMTAIEATIVATAIPTIVAQLGGFALFGWIFAAYLLAQAITIPIYGRLADLFGRKRVFFFGASLFLVGSTLCGFAPSMPTLILCRALQGLGAGAIMPVASTIIGDVYGPAGRARVQGYLSSVWGVSAVIGPLLGAFIVERLHWSLIFWINLPVGIAAMAMLWAFFPETPERRPQRIDFVGALLLAGGTGILMGGLLQADVLGWRLLPLLAVAGLCFALLLRQERRFPEPLLPLALWRNRTILAGNLGGLAAGASMMGISAFLPTYIQGALGRNALTAGTILALMSIGWPISSMLAGRLMLVTSYRTTAVIGGALLVLGSGILLFEDHGLATAGVASFLVGTGMGMCITTCMVSVQGAAAHNVRGIATASAVFARMLGSSLGAAMLGAVLNLALLRGLPGVADPVQRLMDGRARASLSPVDFARLGDSVAAAMHQVFIAAVFFALLAFAFAWLMPAGVRPGHGPEASRD